MAFNCRGGGITQNVNTMGGPRTVECPACGMKFSRQVTHAGHRGQPYVRVPRHSTKASSEEQIRRLYGPHIAGIFGPKKPTDETTLPELTQDMISVLRGLPVEKGLYEFRDTKGHLWQAIKTLGGVKFVCPSLRVKSRISDADLFYGVKEYPRTAGMKKAEEEEGDFDTPDQSEGDMPLAFYQKMLERKGWEYEHKNDFGHIFYNIEHGDHHILLECPPESDLVSSWSHYRQQDYGGEYAGGYTPESLKEHLTKFHSKQASKGANMESKLLTKQADEGVSESQALAGKSEEELAALCKQYSVYFRKPDIQRIMKFVNGPQDEHIRERFWESGSDAVNVLDTLLRRMKKPSIGEVSPEDKRILKNLSDQMTMTVDLYDLREGIGYYRHSPVRLVVLDTESRSPEAWFKNGGPNLAECGLQNVQQLADWLKSKGCRELKKPKPVKYSPPLYD